MLIDSEALDINLSVRELVLAWLRARPALRSLGLSGLWFRQTVLSARLLGYCILDVPIQCWQSQSIVLVRLSTQQVHASGIDLTAGV